MAEPRCDAVRLQPRNLPDLDEDGLPETLFIYRVPQSAALSFDVECFKYRAMGEDSYCPAESLSILLDTDGFPSLLSFLRLSSGKAFSQVKRATDEDGRSFHVGQKVAYWKLFGRPPLTGVIDQFHAGFTSVDDGSVEMDFHADIRLDDGSIEMYVPLEQLQYNDVWSQMKRGLSDFYWQSRGDIELLMLNF